MLLGALATALFAVVAAALAPVSDGVVRSDSSELPPQRPTPFSSSATASAADDDDGLSELLLLVAPGGGGGFGDRLLELGARRPPAVLPASARHLRRRQQRLPPALDAGRGDTATTVGEPLWDTYSFRYTGGDGSYQYTFDVSLPPAVADGSAALYDATLHLYKDHAPAAAGSSRSSPPEPVLLAVYLLPPDGDSGRRLVGSAVVSLAGPGWVRFDVTEALRSWVAEQSQQVSSSGRITALAATTGMRLAVDSASSSESAVNISQLVSFDVRSPRRRPLLDVRLLRRTPAPVDESSDADDSIAAAAQRLRRRGAPPTGQPAAPELPQRTARRRHMYRHATEQRQQPSPPLRPCTAGRCCRKHIYVSFKKLRWDWILDPPGFDAYYCEGRCSRQFEPDTNFGLLKKTLRAYNIANLTNTCAATKYSPLVVWHYDAQGYLVQTVKEDMIVERCGCA